MARVLWLGDAGCHTGFARVTHSIGDRLVRDFGHEISVLATNYDGDYWPTPMHLYRPNKLSGLDRYGQGRIVELLAETMPEAIVILQDPVPIVKFLIDNKNDPTHALLAGGPMKAPILTYVPIDGHSYTPALSSMGDMVAKRIAMTKFGQAEMPGSDLVYHGVDTGTYRPVSQASPMTASNGMVISSRTEAKRALGFDPDHFLVLRVDRNSNRKDYPSTWKALVPLMKRYEDIDVHFHCVPRDDYNLGELMWREPELRPRFRFPSGVDTFQGWPDVDLAILYNAADIFVTTSWGEGFGLTIAEALACGVPVVAQNVSAITEVVGPGGRLIEPAREITTPMGHEQWLPDVPAFTAAIEQLYRGRGSRRKLGEAARKHIVDTFSWDVAARNFDRLIHEAIDQRRAPSGSPDEARPDAGSDPNSPVQHRDEGDDGEGGRGRPTDPSLHSLVHG